jgi:hypothetical protein
MERGEARFISFNPEANAIRHQHLRTPKCLWSHAHAFSSRNWCATIWCKMLSFFLLSDKRMSLNPEANALRHPPLRTPRCLLYMHPHTVYACMCFCATCNDFFCKIKETIKSNKHFFASQANARLSTPKQMLNDLHFYTLLIEIFNSATFSFCSCVWFPSQMSTHFLPSTHFFFFAIDKPTQPHRHIWNCEDMHNDLLFWRQHIALSQASRRTMRIHLWSYAIKERSAFSRCILHTHTHAHAIHKRHTHTLAHFFSLNIFTAFLFPSLWRRFFTPNIHFYHHDIQTAYRLTHTCTHAEKIRIPCTQT